MNKDIYQQVIEVSFLNAHAGIGEDKVENSAAYQQSCIYGPEGEGRKGLGYSLNFPSTEDCKLRPQHLVRDVAVNALLSLTDSELLDKADLCDVEFDELENQLALRAACLGWTGDPMRQPLETIAAIVRVILSKRS